MKKIITFLFLCIGLVGCNINESNTIGNVTNNDLSEKVNNELNIINSEKEINDNDIEAVVEDTIKVPEPYERGLEQLEKADIDQAKRYFELTIEDFPDSPYKYNANVMLSLIHLSESAGLKIVSRETHGGLVRMRDRFDTDEMERVLQVFEKNLELNREVDIEYLKIATNVLNYFEEYQKSLQELEYDYPRPNNRKDSTNLDDLKFFGSTGISYPSETVINEIRRATMEEMFANGVKNLYVSNKKLDFVLYFNYALSIVLYLEDGDLAEVEGETEVRDLAKRFLNKIFELTEDDPYNSIRVGLEADLELINDFLEGAEIEF